MTVHLHTPGHLIAALPVLLGEAVDESLVIVGMGQRGIIAPLMRVDLSACRSQHEAALIAHECSGMLARANAHAAVVVAFARNGGHAEIAALRERIGRACDVTDAWIVSNGRFRSPDCVDPECCPAEGIAVPEPPPGLEGPYVRRRDREYSPPPARKRRAAREALRRALAARERGGAEWRRRQLELWRAALENTAGGHLPPDAATGRLAAALLDMWVRDALIVDLVPGQAGVAESLCGDGGSEGVREALSRMMGVDDPARPHPETIDATVALATHIAWLCPEAVAPALSIVAIAEWWSGHDAAAADAVARALAARDGYRLAELVACALDVSMRPGWLRAS